MERAINCHSEKKRIEELDWLKCICVLLMVAFHLTLIERMYPDAKNIVFVFHMPVFLIISGYVTNTEKDTKTFLTQMTTLAVPYIIMESSYIVAASLLPINEHINCLTIRTFLDILLASDAWKQYGELSELAEKIVRAKHAQRYIIHYGI